MYEFEKLKDEEILLISDNTILKKDEKDINISTVVTNKRLLLLDYPSSVNNYEEALRTTRNQEYLKKKEIILEVNLSDIKEIIEEDYDKYLLSNNNYFYIKDNEVKNKINNK